MTAPAPASVLAGEQQDPVHIACATTERTWCGEPAEDVWVEHVDVDEVCRVCVLVLELLHPADPCPICGSRACLRS